MISLYHSGKMGEYCFQINHVKNWMHVNAPEIITWANRLPLRHTHSIENGVFEHLRQIDHSPPIYRKSFGSAAFVYERDIH